MDDEMLQKQDIVTHWLEAARHVLGDQDTKLAINAKYDPASPMRRSALENGAYQIGKKALLADGRIVDANDPVVAEFLKARKAEKKVSHDYSSPAKDAVNNSGVVPPQEIE